MKISKLSGKAKVIIAAVMTLALAVGAVFAMPASAQTIDDTNPALKFIHIEGNADGNWSGGSYKATGSFTPDNEVPTDGNYEMTTNSFVAWYAEDDIGYAYKSYPVGNTKDDYIMAETEITEFRAKNAVSSDGTTTSPDWNASAGLMIRNSLSADGGMVFMHARSGRILIVYRTRTSGSCGVTYTDFKPSYPIKLRIEKKANIVTASFKTADMSDWYKIRSVGLESDGKSPIYLGLCGHSCNPNIPIYAKFNGFHVEGEGTLDISGDTEETPSEEEKYVAEDANAADNTLLRETFTDGDLTNTPETALNPVWSSPSQSKLTLLDDGNYVWDRVFASGYDYIGDYDWTDYSASLDIKFLKDCDEQLANRVKLYVRHMDVDYTGYCDYAAALEKGNQIALYKRFRTKDGLYVNGDKVALVDVEKYLGDEQWHNLKVEAFDNKIKVYWDGEKVIDYTDTSELKINLKGCIGVSVDETACYIDNITVLKLEDEWGGDYDNDIGGNFNQAIPDYLIKEYENKDLPY